MHTTYIEIDGQEIGFSKVDSDMYGNPRIVVHFLALGLEDYVPVKGFTRYRGKAFGGGYVFQSYNHEDTIRWALETVKEFNKG